MHTINFKKEFWLSKDFIRDPYPFYEALRSQPVCEIDDVFLVSRFADVMWAIEHPEIFSSEREPLMVTVHGRPCRFGQAVSDQDPPVHATYRSIAHEGVRPSRIRQQEHLIRSLIDELIDAFIDAGQVEFCEAFAAPMPLRVKCALFGYPRDREDDLLRWNAAYIRLRQKHLLPSAQTASLQQVVDEFASFMTDLVQDRCANPRDDIITTIAHAPGADHVNTVGIVTSLLIGGGVTARNLIANAMLVLMQEEALLARTRIDTSLIDLVLEECLRLESPAQWIPRSVIVDTELGGVVIPAGSKALLLLGAANRDKSVFDNPDEFRLSRPNRRVHLGFGKGIHACVGAPLMRLEAKIGFEQLLSRLDDLRLRPGQDVPPYPMPNQRGPDSLYLQFQRRH